MLTDHPFVEFLLHVKKLLPLALHHPCHGNTRPARDHARDIFGVDLLLDKSPALVDGSQLPFEPLDFRLRFADPPVAEFRHAAVIALSLCLVGFKTHLLDGRFGLLDGLENPLFSLPAGPVFRLLLLQVGDLPAELGHLLFILFPLDGFPFDLQLGDPPFRLIEFLGNRIHFEPQLGSRLIHQVDGLVGKKPVGNVAL